MRRLLIPCTLLLCILLAPTVAQAKPVLGIADNKPETFLDKRLTDLHLKYARINIPWDVLQDPNTLPTVDSWMAAAKLAGMKPLVSFDRSRRAAYKTKKPSSAEMTKALKGWRARWSGQIKEVSVWNEPNQKNVKAATAAKWWLAMRKSCPTCTVLPGELVDRGNAIKWAKDFEKAAKRSAAIWPLHAYVDANNLTNKSTKAFLKAVKGKLWLTETGGVVSRSNPTVRFKGSGVAFQTKATDYLLNKLTKNQPRLQRIYIYSWSPGSGDVNWDSGLVGPDNTGRPALNVVRKYLGMGPIDLAAPITPTS